MSFSGGKKEAMNLLYQLIICGVTHGSASPQRWDMGSAAVPAGESRAVSLHAAASVKLPKTWSTELESKPGHCMKFIEMSIREARTAMFQSCRERGPSLPQAMDLRKANLSA